MSHEGFMARAIELARRAAFTSPNPKVGCVVVAGGTVIGEGWHEGPGTPHAEANALEGIDARGATLYVTLEPCNFSGRMPPCAPVIVSSGVGSVVAAIEDPDERVRGAGFDHLRDHGVEVVAGVLAEEAADLNREWIHHRSTGRTWVTLKLAMSIDGRLAAADGSARWISSPEARRETHRRRSVVDAVLVGAGTVLADDPQLTVRDVEPVRQPLRIVLDSRGRIPAGARVLDDAAPTLVVTTDLCPHETHTAYKEAGAEVMVLSGADRRVDLRALVAELARRELIEVFCEGGAELATELLRAGVVSRLEVHRGPLLLGSGPSLGDLGIPDIDRAHRWSLREAVTFGDTIVETYERGAS